LQKDIYFRVNYDRFNIHIRNKVSVHYCPFAMTEHPRQLIEAAARERFNDGAAEVLRAALKATESDQKTLFEIRSGTFLLCRVFSLSNCLVTKSLPQSPAYLCSWKMSIH
jgi:hypothetical protein